jgi:hypothetical protein
MGLVRLLQMVAIISFGLQSAIAAEAISVAVPTECATESHASNIAYPFIDRIGDVRFAPRPLATAADAVTIVQPDLDGLPVSAAMTGDRETLLITTYHDILSLNIHSGQVTRLAPDLASLNSKKYVPTGIAIGRRTGSVFLANYLANNILIGHISTNRVTFEQELSGDRLVSPENVAITPDESWLVSANFDGSSATAFTLVGDRYVWKWTTQIPSAHGVAILGDLVFVSSLQLRKIIVLSLNDGQEIGSFGQSGWNTSCLDFLWPTDIHTADNNLIVITDAHTGGIYRIAFDGTVGKLLDVVGGIAPGPAGLQMPYSTASVGGDLAVLSTFSQGVDHWPRRVGGSAGDRLADRAASLPSAVASRSRTVTAVRGRVERLCPSGVRANGDQRFSFGAVIRRIDEDDTGADSEDRRAARDGS